MPSDPSATDFASARTAMIDCQLRPQGVSDPQIIEAFQSVPREAYVAPDAQALAYGDRGVLGIHGAMLMPPAALAQLIQALEPVAGERALVIESGDSYAAAVLEAIGVEISSSEGQVDMILVDGAIDHVPDIIPNRLRDGGRFAAALRSDGVTRLMLGRKAGASLGLVSIGDAFVPPLAGFEQPQAFVF